MKTVPLPAEYKNGATRLLVEHLNDLPRSIGSAPCEPRPLVPNRPECEPATKRKHMRCLNRVPQH
jgi:hypothetical protein